MLLGKLFDIYGSDLDYFLLSTDFGSAASDPLSPYICDRKLPVSKFCSDVDLRSVQVNDYVVSKSVKDGSVLLYVLTFSV